MPIKINYKKCNGCKICYDICPMDVFGWDEEKELPALDYEAECWHEGHCVIDCPRGAIDITYPVMFW